MSGVDFAMEIDVSMFPFLTLHRLLLNIGIQLTAVLTIVKQMLRGLEEDLELLLVEPREDEVVWIFNGIKCFETNSVCNLLSNIRANLSEPRRVCVRFSFGDHFG